MCHFLWAKEYDVANNQDKRPERCVRMTGKIQNFYAGGNTAQGFTSLFDSSLQNLERIYILKGGPGTGKSTLIRAVGNKMLEKGLDIWFIHCSSDNDSLDGVIIPELKAGIVDGTAPHVIEPKLPGAVEQYVNLGEAWDAEQLKSKKSDIAVLQQQLQQAYASAYDGFAKALRIHDEWEKIFIENMDFQAADQLTEEYIDLFFGASRLNKKSVVYHRFLGAATPKGAVDFIQNLTSDIKKRYFIKGRPGSGKSTMLKKMAAAAEERGYNVEVYHCGFDPNSLDMLIFRERGIAIFDSTAPHEHHPDRDSDEIIDMYERCIQQGTDEKYAEQIADVKERYAAQMKASTAYLAQVKQLHDQLESIYVEAMDFNRTNRFRFDILTELDIILEKNH